MRVLLVDDHPLFRQALALIVGALGTHALIQEFETVKAAREALDTSRERALVLLDLGLSDNRGMQGLIALKSLFPEVPVAIVSGHDDEETVLAAQACGAAGFVPKTLNRTGLMSALQALMTGATWFPPLHNARSARNLTQMQMRVMDCIKRGLMNKQIAFELGMSEHTVKYHLAGIFRKLGCQTRAQLVSAVMERMPA